jgi:hypothetical protein
MCGKSNTVADRLSRLDQDRQELFSDAVMAICDAILVSICCPSAESILMSQSLDDLVNASIIMQTFQNHLSIVYW